MILQGEKSKSGPSGNPLRGSCHPVPASPPWARLSPCIKAASPRIQSLWLEQSGHKELRKFSSHQKWLTSNQWWFLWLGQRVWLNQSTTGGSRSLGQVVQSTVPAEFIRQTFWIFLDTTAGTYRHYQLCRTIRWSAPPSTTAFAPMNVPCFCRWGMRLPHPTQ